MLEPITTGLPKGLPSGPLVFNNELPFRAFLERLPAGAYTCDPDGLITYFNQHAAQLWGRSPKLNDPIDRFCGSFKLYAIDGSPILHNQCWMALALQNLREYNGHEIMIERPDGRRLTALAHANPIHNEMGRLIGAVNVLVDISDRKQAEEALKEADRSKNEFLATLAHELRNPLAPIRAAVKVLQIKSKPTPESQSALDVIERQTRQMTRLIDDLLDIARITSNKLELRRAPIELSQVLSAAVETSRPLIEQRGHKLIVKAAAAPIHIDGDLVRLAQVISNLLNNAAKYTDRGGRIWLESSRKKDEAVVKVIDTGVGISAEMLPRIFEMFTQAGRANESRSGLGIGLTLVKRLVEMHGGTITAHSDGVGQGSEFVLRMPVALAKAPADLPVKPKLKSRKEPKKPIKILVVDDNQDSADSLGMLLKLLGNDVRVVNDGLAAVEIAKEFEPRVLLLDIGLPTLNGYEAAKEIRKQPWGSRALLVAVTGWGERIDRQRSKKAGFDHHLVKPVDPDVLTTLLAAL
ncbi:MAG TPA: ATP-binding protein [Pyrinomonadaceae bacterium]|nr:ATP-binding protein [Pyrinomonadaceae bacterium]